MIIFSCQNCGEEFRIDLPRIAEKQEKTLRCLNCNLELPESTLNSLKMMSEGYRNAIDSLKNSDWEISITEEPPRGRFLPVHEYQNSYWKKISRENGFAKHYGFQSIDDLIEKSEQRSSPTICGKYGYFITPLPNGQFMAWDDDSIEGICVCGIDDSPAEASKNMFIKEVSSEHIYDGKDIGMLLQRFVEGKRLQKLI